MNNQKYLAQHPFVKDAATEPAFCLTTQGKGLPTLIPDPKASTANMQILFPNIL